MSENTKNKPPYRKWVGVLLAILLPGSAHVLSGKPMAGIKWFAGLIACGLVFACLLATPGTTALILSVAFGLACVVLWFIIVKRSYRPVRRIGFFGWFAFIAVALVINNGRRLLGHQFVRPFKVPVGDMQPTIYGIHGASLSVDSPDRPGFLNLFISGRRYVEIESDTSGILTGPRQSPDSRNHWTYMVGSKEYPLPRVAPPLKKPGELVSTGETLWSGVITAGDHILVERWSYRFEKPKRGDIVAFRTKGIEDILENAIYIKRIAGLPGERIRIEQPFLIVNGEKVLTPEIFKTISSESDGYAGFQELNHSNLAKQGGEFTVGPNEYYVLGDNTVSSFDSRSWGAVPEKNIIGKVTRVYWPFSRLKALEEK